MKAIYYGDRRDRVKWGGLIHLAKEHDISHIIQVAFYREDAPRRLSNGVPLPETVWKHFSDLKNIRRLEQPTGRTIKVIEDLFKPDFRDDYIDGVVNKLKGIMIIL